MQPSLSVVSVIDLIKYCVCLLTDQKSIKSALNLFKNREGGHVGLTSLRGKESVNERWNFKLSGFFSSFYQLYVGIYTLEPCINHGSSRTCSFFSKTKHEFVVNLLPSRSAIYTEIIPTDIFWQRLYQSLVLSDFQILIDRNFTFKSFLMPSRCHFCPCTNRTAGHFFFNAVALFMHANPPQHNQPRLISFSLEDSISTIHHIRLRF